MSIVENQAWLSTAGEHRTTDGPKTPDGKNMNLYTIILSLFIVAGLGTSAWGWRMLHQGRRALNWPQAAGTIEISELRSTEDELLPHIEFSYQVDGKTYQQTLTFPAGTTPTEEFSNSYTTRYPAGKPVTVYHHPNDPTAATIEPVPQGDWLVLAMGLATTGFGILFLFFG